ncbi:MAG: hypothetical protein M3R61_06830 [Chloroflexota bacterium]|nr:hypothetical protein [Chloroflexota bacterium]
MVIVTSGCRQRKNGRIVGIGFCLSVLSFVRRPNNTTKADFLPHHFGEGIVYRYQSVHSPHGSLIFKTVRKIRPTATFKEAMEWAISPHFGGILRKRFTHAQNVTRKVGGTSLFTSDFAPKVVWRILFTPEKISEP